MADKGTAAPADLRVNSKTQPDNTFPASPTSPTSPTSPIDAFFPGAGKPQALRQALRAADSSLLSTPNDSSEEDYDDESRKPVAVLLRRRKEKENAKDSPPLTRTGSNLKVSATSSGVATPSDGSSEAGQIDDLGSLRGAKVYTLASDDKELREILRRGMLRAKDAQPAKRKGKFSDYVFTRKFSAFDRQNEIAANSPYHGFFALFWIAISFLLVKIAADNWRNTGNPLGTNDIIKNMLKKDFVLLLASDGVMCASTGVSWILQVLIYKDFMDWDSAGWLVQSAWEIWFIIANVCWTQIREWPWSHTVFFVLHTLVMLMKQHSYSFYNGYLSTAYKKRQELQRKLKQLEHVETVQSPSQTRPFASSISTDHTAHAPSVEELKQRRRSIHTGGETTFSKDLEEIESAIESNEPLDLEQIHVFERIIKWEIDQLTEEINGKSTSPSRAYPRNLTFTNQYEYIVFPTLVYELEYPRAESINWAYVAEKSAATFGVIFVMIMISQAFIYPVVMKTVAMKESGMPIIERFLEFPWLLSDLILPFMIEYILSWYVIWEAVLNLLAEVTYFADRQFYSDWWNCISWDQFARDWNRPVHNFLLRHVYHSSISAMKVNKHTATLITFFLSAVVHELVMWCIFKKLRGYLLFLQMFQLPD
ncbi:Sterol O-acyltransferase 2 (Sterol-ester synthase 2) [Cytospora paraplurivora]|uniref:Sterol O-acyltransferase 2 (Sterol-ester synthase 2) n=1 Tax=Cytospora paraplurivora TaxID=2898453 RepID=A0AAN9YIQ3_9PEZI